LHLQSLHRFLSILDIVRKQGYDQPDTGINVKQYRLHLQRY
jgi:hypothetical protein